MSHRSLRVMYVLSRVCTENHTEAAWGGSPYTTNMSTAFSRLQKVMGMSRGTSTSSLLTMPPWQRIQTTVSPGRSQSGSGGGSSSRPASTTAPGASRRDMGSPKKPVMFTV